MTREEKLIEMQACRITANEMARGDRYMDTQIKKIVDDLREKADRLEEELK